MVDEVYWGHRLLLGHTSCRRAVKDGLEIGDKLRMDIECKSSYTARDASRSQIPAISEEYARQSL